MWRRAVGGAALLGSVGIASTVRFARLDVSRNGVAAEGEEEEDGFYNVEVLRNKPLGANTRLVRFKLSDPKAGLPYTLGSYVQVKGLSFNVDESFPFGKKVCKPYLPVQALDKKGFFDVVVHTYSSPLGDTSRFLANRRQVGVFFPFSFFSTHQLTFFFFFFPKTGRHCSNTRPHRARKNRQATAGRTACWIGCRRFGVYCCASVY